MGQSEGSAGLIEQPVDVTNSVPPGVAELALRVLETAPGPRTTLQSPQRWSEDASWKLDYNNLAKLTPEDLAERRKEFDVVKAVIKTKTEGL